MMIHVKIIPAVGDAYEKSFPKHSFFTSIGKLLEWPDGCDTVNLRDGTVMLVDDTAHIRNEIPPVNPVATKLYHSVCRPGTTHEILGSVAIVNDKDFE